MTKTTDSGGNKLNLRNKINVVWRNVTFTGTITGVLLQVRVKSTGLWETTSGDYVDWYWDGTTEQAPTDGTGIKLTTSTAPTDIGFELFGLGLPVPAEVEARDLTVHATLARHIGGQTTSAEIFDAFRIVLNGTSPDLTGGTQYVIYY
jgi:hypothetical protein